MNRERVPLLMQVGKVAAWLGLSRWTVAELCRSGDFKYVPFGRRKRRIRTDSVLAWIDRNTVHTAEDLRRLVDGRRKS